MFEFVFSQEGIITDNIPANDKIIKLISSSSDRRGGQRVVALYESGTLLVLAAQDGKLEAHWSCNAEISDKKQLKQAQLSIYDDEQKFALVTKNQIKIYHLELGDTANNAFEVNIKQPIVTTGIPISKCIMVVNKEKIQVFNPVSNNIQQMFSHANIQQLLWLDDMHLLSAASLDADEAKFKMWSHKTILNGAEQAKEDSPELRSSRSGSVRGRMGSDLSNHLSFKPQLIKVGKHKIATTHPKGIKIWYVQEETVIFDKLIEMPGVNQLVLLPENYLLSTTPDQTIVWNLEDSKAVFYSERVLQQVISLENKYNHYVCVDKDGKLLQGEIKRSDLSATNNLVVNSNFYAGNNATSSNSISQKEPSTSAGTSTSASTSTFDIAGDGEKRAQKKNCCVML